MTNLWIRRFVAEVLFLISAILSALLVLMVAAPTAYGYVDPSVMTYTIQAVAGVAVALSAVLGVALRRTRRVLFRILKIDENANKIVEPNVKLVAGNDRELILQKAETCAIRDKEILASGFPAKPLNWKQRIARAAISSAFSILTVFIATPLDIVAGGAGSLSFSYTDALPLVIAAGVVIAAALAFLLSLLKGKAFDIVNTLICAFGICCYIQSLFFNGALPVADGSELNLFEYKKVTLASSIVWAGILAGLLLFEMKRRALSRSVLVAICSALIVVQGVSVVVTSIEHGDAMVAEKPYHMSTEGLYELGGDSNVIVFVLDTFDTKTMDYLLEKDPNVLENFTGFTYFRNSAGAMIPTRYGVPYLLTGLMPKPGQTWQEYEDSRYTESTFLKDISDQGYDVGVYTDSLGLQYSQYTGGVLEVIDNIHTDYQMEVNKPSLLLTLYKVSLYREMPWLLKPLFWFHTDEVNQSAFVGDQAPYVMDDIAYSDRLFEDGVRVSGNERAFRFIHLQGAHKPYVMGEDGHKTSPKKTDKKTQALGSLRVVEEYIRQMKELGLYDSATIIITSDHGDWWLTDEPLQTTTSPFLLVKPSENAEEAARPCVVSEVPTGHGDFCATVIDAVGGDSAAYGPTVFEITEGERPRYYWMTTSDGHYDLQWLQYEIDGHVMNFEDWKLTGEAIDIPKE